MARLLRGPAKSRIGGISAKIVFQCVEQQWDGFRSSEFTEGVDQPGRCPLLRGPQECWEDFLRSPMRQLTRNRTSRRILRE